LAGRRKKEGTEKRQRLSIALCCDRHSDPPPHQTQKHARAPAC
jgi:hypothetical protein